MTSTIFCMLSIGILLISINLCASSCPYHCTECESNDKCTACEAKFGLKVDGSRTICEECGSGKFRCEACKDYNTEYCTQCSSVYKLKDGKCLDCGLYCDDCSADDVCTQCKYKKVLVRKAGTVVCESCVQSYECLKCANFAPEKCIECRTGYKLDANNRCVTCEQSNCKECDSDQTTCRKCDIGSRLTTENKCEYCLFYGCAKCETDKRECEYCKPGYGGLAAGRCTTCKIQGCLKCPDPTTCEECNPDISSCRTNGAATTTPGSATSTSEPTTGCEQSNCKECDSDLKTCRTCDVGSRLTTENKCEFCFNYGCAKCEPDKYRCQECKPGYGGLAAGRCTSCSIYGCLKCSDPTICEECNPDISSCRTEAATTTPEQTTECQQSICINCDSDQTTCRKCEIGSRLTAENKCQFCLVYGCGTCETDRHVCQECKPGYGGLLANYFCLRCKINGCLKCPELHICRECNPDISSCRIHECEQSNCIKCDSDKTTCRTCDVGSRLTTKNKCEFCAYDACAKCEADKYDCDECKPGYGGLLADGWCSSCKTYGCLKCPNTTMCEECDPDISSCRTNDCRVLNAHCLRCGNDGTCTQCEELYKLENGKCTALW